MTDQQRLATSEILFGKWAVAGANVLLAQSVDAQKAYEQQIEKSTGAMSSMANTIRTSLANKLLILKSKVVDIGISIVEAFHKKFPTAIDDAIAALGRIDIDSVVQQAKDLIDKMIWLGKTVVDLKPLIEAFLLVMAAFKLAMKADAVITLAKTLMTVFAPAAGVATGAQWGLNVAMFANPIGVVILLVLLLAAAVIWLAFNFRDVEKSILGSYKAMEKGNSVFSEFAGGAAKSLGTQLEGMIFGFNAFRASILKAMFAWNRWTSLDFSTESAIRDDLLIERATKTGRFHERPGGLGAEMALGTMQAMASGSKGVQAMLWGETGQKAPWAEATKKPEQVSYQAPNFMRASVAGEFKEPMSVDVVVKNEFNGLPEGLSNAIKSTAYTTKFTAPHFYGKLGKQ
jgi:hypothetical protein